MKRMSIVLILGLVAYSSQISAATCLYVSSYHAGYEWNDGIEEGIHRVLDGHCEIKKFYMDTKRKKTPADIEQMAITARDKILNTRPDIVIACDDNAAKYLIKPYFKDASTPFVFCGINWTVKPYGFPYSNVTGMVEISPVKPLLKEILNIRKNVRQGIYIGPDVLSQHKEFELNKKIYQKEGMLLSAIFVKNMAQWEQAYIEAQHADFIIMGNNGGINDWDINRATEISLDHAQTLSVTNYEWMAPYAMLAMTKIAEEQGEWAAEVALAVLNGENISNIPIVPNRRQQMYINLSLLQKAGIKLSDRIIHQSRKAGP